MSLTRPPAHPAASSHPGLRWRLVAPLLAVTLLMACGGDRRITEAPAPAPTPAPETAPTSLSYDDERPLYVVGEAITPNLAQLSGGTLSSFGVSPALPAGLSLDSRNGAITGTPTTLQREASVTVRAGNGAGAAQAELRLTVTGRGAWSSAATIPGARHYAQLTTLANGKLLVTGGIIGASYSNSAHLYDPATGTWSLAAPMLWPRAEHAAVRLQDGRVLVVGGQSAVSTSLAEAELYDPVANTWTATGSMAAGRTNATATLLGDGSVLIAGGYHHSPGSTFLATVERWHPTPGTWAAEPPMTSTRAQHAAALLPDGQTWLLAGGVNSGGFVTSAELYRVDGSGSTAVAYGVSGNVHQAVNLDDGSVLVTSDGSNVARRFDPATSTWRSSTQVSTRSQPILIRLADGRVLAAGGNGLNSAEIYNPDHNRWTPAATMAFARHAAVAGLLGDGSVLAVSGTSTAGNVNATERYTP